MSERGRTQNTTAQQQEERQRFLRRAVVISGSRQVSEEDLFPKKKP
ncbi:MULTISPECIES: hypothetical protein [Actinosynnema]|nr:hypothetical protein [Actinosynnema pretiosum]